MIFSVFWTSKSPAWMGFMSFGSYKTRSEAEARIQEHKEKLLAEVEKGLFVQIGEPLTKEVVLAGKWGVDEQIGGYA